MCEEQCEHYICVQNQQTNKKNREM